MIKTAAQNGLEISMEVTTEFEQHRIDSFFDKEPETIRWIDELMQPGDTFYDVGANVGVFALYAAKRHGDALDIRAFEPAYHNYFRLCRNIAINDLAHVLGYCIALGESAGSDSLQLVSTESGSASHSFEGGSSQRPDSGTVVSQGSLTLSLDELVAAFGLPSPQHVKVDIDGYEEAFLRGARNTLAEGSLKSLLIEVTNEGGSKDRIVRSMAGAGFHAEHPLNSIDGHSRVRRARSGNAHIENVIFTR